MPIKLPKIIGHRGVRGYAPENTIESVQTAADMEIEWIEIDVKLTKDEIPIIFHDEELERTTNGHGKVAETDYEDIKNLEAGSFFADSFSGVKIPTLEEMLEVIIELDLGLNLEIKPCPGREVETTEVALDVLSRYWDAHDKLLISSFSHVSLETAHHIARDWNRGLLLDGEALPENWKDLCDYLDVSTLNISDELASKTVIDAIKDYDKPVLVFTVNDPVRARELQGFGITSIFSDVPDVTAEGFLTVH
jgi:glycerophosphoryl diester phosphodiesterase